MNKTFTWHSAALGLLATASVGIFGLVGSPSFAQSTPPAGTAPEAMHGNEPWGPEANNPMLYASRVRPAASFSAHMTSSQVVPASVSQQAGNVLFTLNAERNRVYMTMRLTSFDNPITAIRIRRGGPGSEGEVIKLIPLQPQTANITRVGDPKVTTLQTPSGTTTISSDQNLTRDNSVPPNASGNVSNDLMANSKLFASLPVAPPNNLRYTWTVWDNSQPLTPQFVDDMINGRLHIDVVTAGNPTGEIRGQITNSSNRMDGFNQLPH